jgi:hypothetical protein
MAIIKLNTRSLSDDSVTTPKIGSGAVEGAMVTPSGRRNMVYNGAMEVAQRGTSLTATTSNIYTVDRFQWNVAGNGAEYAVTQETDAPDGFAKSVKIATTTTGGTNNLSYLRQRFEGQDTYHLAYGSSGAKSTTLSFWVKSNITGTFGVAVVQHSTTQRGSYHHYTIASANTWQKVVVNVPGDTGGASIYNQTMECSIDWFLSGDDTGSTPDGTWGARTSDQFMGTGTTELQSSTSNYWQITGVQWELGDVATPFEHRSYGEELALCQRYFEKQSFPGNTQCCVSMRWSGYGYMGHIPHLVEKRATPTITSSGVVRHMGSASFSGNITPNWQYQNKFGTGIYTTATNGPTADAVLVTSESNDFEINIDAEL